MAESATSARPQVATVRFGPYNQPGAYVGKTIGELKQSLGATMNIPTDAVAYKGKEKLSEDYKVQPGETIEFSKPLGEKG